MKPSPEWEQLNTEDKYLPKAILHPFMRELKDALALWESGTTKNKIVVGIPKVPVFVSETNLRRLIGYLEERLK